MKAWRASIVSWPSAMARDDDVRSFVGEGK